jgi:hypothetical protein
MPTAWFSLFTSPEYNEKKIGDKPLKTILDERLEQAHDMSLGLHDAIHLSTHLLEELGNYLERRQRRRIHTSFDDLLNDLLPGLALAIHLLADKETPVEQVDGAQR